MNDLEGPIDIAEVMEIIGGDEELLIECFNDFLSDMPQTLDEIRSAIEQKNALNLNEAAHKLKGSLRYMAAAQAADVAYRLEIMGKEQKLELSNDMFKSLVYECEKVKKFMEQYKTEI
jgi:HPt (histidine-containing phosphotransfer) domain-containing protein